MSTQPHNPISPNPISMVKMLSQGPSTSYSGCIKIVNNKIVNEKTRLYISKNI